MYELLLAFAVVLFALVKGREHFGLVVGTSADLEGTPGMKGYIPTYTTDTKTEKGTELLSTYPNTCPPDKTDLDAALCYPKCKPGFHGVGPVCWADTQNVGVGIPIGLNPCPDGWSNDGLICREPIWNDCSWRALGVCWGRLRGGKLLGRLNNFCPAPFRKAGNGYDTGDGDCVWPTDVTVFPKFMRQYAIRKRGQQYPKTMGICSGPGSLSPDHIEYVAGLCYKPCTDPELRERVPGMPYLCYKGEGLSYGRGVGSVPSVFRVGRVWNPF
jgi:hypothetical protein